MRIIIAFILFIFTLAVVPLAAQVKADNSLKNTNPAYVNKYRRIDNYLVDHRTPVKIVQLNFNVFTGPGTLQESEEVRTWLKQTLAWVNGWYSNNGAPTDSLPGVQRVPDTKIRFEIGERIYFYNDSQLSKSCNVHAMEKVVKTADPSRVQYLNVYFNFGPCTQHASAPAPGFDYYTTVSHIDGSQYVYIPVQDMGYATSQCLAHELGHTLDLMHTYEASCCHETCDASSPEYLDDVFGTEAKKKCWHDGGWSCDPNSSSNTCTNNIMGGVAGVTYYFSPKQIAKMHRALAIKTTKKYVKETGSFDKPVVIKGEEVWDFDMRVYGDIIVKKGSKLVIKGNVIIPENASIIVRKKGKIEIDGGKVIKSTSQQPAEIRRR